MAWTIEYFEKKDATVPAATWEDSIDPKLLGKLATFVKHIAANEGRNCGNMFEKCHSQPGLFEVRAKTGKDLAREYCMRDGERLVLLSGIVKPIDSPTPQSAFDEANANMQEYKATKKVRAIVDEADRTENEQAKQGEPGA